MPSRTTPQPRVTRLAPSPTGALHLGNARTFLINWAVARQQGMRIVLRIEDLDSPRVKPGADQQAIDDLRWLGIDWDTGPFYQRSDLRPYHQALDTLRRRGLVYPCRCTRREIESAQSAPHADDHELRYPGTCRPPGTPGTTPGMTSGGALGGEFSEGHASQDPAAWRLIVPDEPISFTDEPLGPQLINVQQEVGDFIVATKAGLPAYQLAVVVDDARQSITDVIRGDDLMPSTARQLWLYRFLELTPVPRYLHLPLVLGPDGRRLAKRHGDTRLSWYRQQGVPPQRVIGLLAKWCGLAGRYDAMDATEFLASFSLSKLPRSSALPHPQF